MRVFRACPFRDSRRLAAEQFTVSQRAEFPAGREKCREFRRFSRFLRTSVSKTSANSAFCKRIPYADEQGIFSRRQGIFGREQGIWLEIEFRQRHIGIG